MSSDTATNDTTTAEAADELATAVASSEESDADADGSGSTEPQASTPEPEAEDQDGDTDDTEAQDAEEEEQPKRGREEAKLRKRAQAAEAERDQLAACLEALQRQQVENLVSASGVKPPAVWAVANIADLIDPDTGTVNTEAVTAAIKTAQEQFGLLPPKGTIIPGVGQRPSTPPETSDPWAKAFEVKRSR